MAETDQGTRYGNLMAYKLYVLPAAKKMYGGSRPRIKHHQNVRQLLYVLAVSGTSTTWQMTKRRFPNDNARVREKEKEYRRLLIGRTDRGRHSSGVMEFGLVVKDGRVMRHPVSDMYRLSLHGVLYCMNALGLSNGEIDTIARNYSKVLPKVFGRWEYLKSFIGDDVYKIRILAKGLLLDNPTIVRKPDNPLYELMSYIHVKYHRHFESIAESDLAEQISLWFYTRLLHEPHTARARPGGGAKRLIRILDADQCLKRWYLEFARESYLYYNDRASIIKNSGLI